jgi:predicted transcriptional regulator
MRSSVRDIMTTHVVAVRASASFKEIAVQLRRQRVSAFPVLDDDGAVIGIVSEADMLPKEAMGDEQSAAVSILRQRAQEKAHGITAADLMTHPAVTVAPEDSVEHAAWLMYARGVKRVPVTDAAGHLVGIVTRTDVLSVFDRPDEEIREQILDEVIRGEFGADPDEFTVTVKDGIVTMTGSPASASVGRDMLTRARHVQGVVSVRDRFSYPSVALPAQRTGPARAGPGRRHAAWPTMSETAAYWQANATTVHAWKTSWKPNTRGHGSGRLSP